MATNCHLRLGLPPGAGLTMVLGLAALAGCGGWRQAEVPVFCYRTLADVSCYERPDVGREGQLVGGYLLDPDDPAAKGYWLARASASVSR